MKNPFRTPIGNRLKLRVPKPAAWSDSVFVVAGHKCGSVLLTRIIEDIATEAKLPAIPVASAMFKQGIPVATWPDTLYAFMERDGYIFYSIRDLARLPSVHTFHRSRKIFLIRDPRDIAVSYYYSTRQSHRIPDRGAVRERMLMRRSMALGMTIDEFVVSGRADHVLDNIKRFADYLSDDLSTFYRYEDVIYDKRRWVAHVASQLNAKIPTETSNMIADKHDVFPKREQAENHIRQVKPGNYRNKLAPETIRYVENNNEVFFSKFGYQYS